ncbi:hypothetical protein REG_0810 [Candidatus Regiella insecticola LSR1]|uniref:Uncharacterized protein n=1 Tax=Candidatus Regiella insecticola LSR1 TaxID=663321 RepID=E0WS68_9ENTR|nr:hypothetical protein REG_0799 [Candidatus Regiella insecticola LSR1]EFL92212.1 hypothetical protein REG_0810 [Candidatus Regiella insecticola LSR1]
MNDSFLDEYAEFAYMDLHAVLNTFITEDYLNHCEAHSYLCRLLNGSTGLSPR